MSSRNWAELIVGAVVLFALGRTAYEWHRTPEGIVVPPAPLAEDATLAAKVDELVGGKQIRYRITVVCGACKAPHALEHVFDGPFHENAWVCHVCEATCTTSVTDEEYAAMVEKAREQAAQYLLSQ